MATTSTTFAPQRLRTLVPAAKLPPSTTPTMWRERLPLMLVVAIALLLAVAQYRQFLDAHRQIWYSGTHDRSAHYFFTLKLAADVRGGHLLHWLEDVNTARIWTPLQALLASAALIVGGFDSRLAVWPSLAGWVLAIVFGFLVARRLVRRGGNLAGAVAALFIALSPAQRAYSTDIMLESLGAGLSLVVLYAYLRAVQRHDEGERTGRWLGLASALFLHKYNYWLLVVLSIVGAEVLYRRRELWQSARAFLSALDWRGMLRAQARAISNYALLSILVLVAAIWIHGDRPVVWHGREIGVFPPYNVMQIAYWIVLFRLVIWWKAAGRAWVADSDVRLRQVVYWHLWPAAWWLALPKHIGPFVWFLAPTNAGTGQKSSLRTGLSEYASWALTDYHVTLTCALIAAGLLLLSLVIAPKLRRGGLAVLFLLLLGAFLAGKHPNRKARYAHSWIAAGWVCAGAGAASLVYGRLTKRLPQARPWLACALFSGLAFAHFANGIPQAHALEGGPQARVPSLLDVTDWYLPYCAGKQPVTILSAVGLGPMTQTTFCERYGSFDRLEDHRFAFGPPGEPNRQAFRAWLSTTNVETIVYLEARPGPQVGTPWEDISENRLHEELRTVLDDQQRFRPIQRQEFPHQGCAVTVWRREANESR